MSKYKKRCTKRAKARLKKVFVHKLQKLKKLKLYPFARSGISRVIRTSPDVSEPDVTQRTTVATPAPKGDCKQRSHLQRSSKATDYNGGK